MTIEGHQQYQSGQDEPDRARGRPALRTGVGQPVHQGHETGGHGRRTGDVVPRPTGDPALDEHPGSRDGGDQGDRRPHPEAPPPRHVLGEHAAEHQPERPSTGGDASEDRERPSPLLLTGEGHREQRQGRRCHQSRESALQSTGREKHRPVGRQPTQGRGQGEPEQPDQERPLPPGVVRNAPAQQQEPAEGQRVPGHDPLPVRVRDTEIELSGGKGDVHDRRVQHEQQLGHRNDREGQTFVPDGRRSSARQRFSRRRTVEPDPAPFDARCHGNS